METPQQSKSAYARWMQAHPRIQRLVAWSFLSAILAIFLVVVWHAARTHTLYLFAVGAVALAVRHGMNKKRRASSANNPS
jgi:uncharacterized membrane protein HdeD (DUF308 family)